MSEQARRLALEGMSVITEGRLEFIDELIHPDYHNHEAAADRPGGPEGFRQTTTILRSAFADIRFEPQDVIAEADRVAVRGQFSARQVGPFAGMPATGRQISIQQIHIWRVTAGKLVEHWAVRDQAEAMRQLGLLSLRGADRGLR
ncbi:MAG: ester cyclase [Solirubrobacteraceae bacterium]